MTSLLPRVIRSTVTRTLPNFNLNSSSSQLQRLYFSPNTETLDLIQHQQHQQQQQQHQQQQQQRPPRNKKKERKRLRRLSSKSNDPTSAPGILQHEIQALVNELQITNHTVPISLISHYRQREHIRIINDVKVLKLSSTGVGLAIYPSELDPSSSHLVLVIPFATEGDVVQVGIRTHFEHYAEAHIIQVQQPSLLRKDELVQCKHFTKCSGCQLQMMSYDQQLQFKTQVVKNAYRQFGHDEQLLPIENTVPSPLQYQYRSKLTPHFNGNREQIELGFEQVGLGGKKLLNVDSCSIATSVLSNALHKDRLVLENIVRKYKHSGTILLRDKSIQQTNTTGYTTDHSEIITQQIGDYQFQFPAGEFFQNNNSILPLLLNHIKQYIDPKIHKNIVDTYCGSGFFGISLSQYAERLIGIEISKGNLAFAQHNAKLNNIHNSQFLLGSSEEIFKGLDAYNPDETVVILDPSRKGSTHDYLSQLSQFKPNLIVYISCNVFSQARDLAYFCNETTNGQQYEISTITGYDFFPQTKHVESLVVLKLKTSP